LLPFSPSDLAQARNLGESSGFFLPFFFYIQSTDAYCHFHQEASKLSFISIVAALIQASSSLSVVQTVSQLLYLLVPKWHHFLFAPCKPPGSPPYT
jgi:hypothetical protein